MNIAGRLKKLEAQAVFRDKGDIILFDEYGKCVDAEIVRKPTLDIEGIAKLADGSEMPIIFEADWDRMGDTWIFDSNNAKFEFMDERPADAEPLPSLEGRLFMRYSGCDICHIIPATREDL